MTIGIVAYGPNAGLAVFQALRAAERVAWGAIGGFASFAAISTTGGLLRAQTQRGGTTTLFVDGDRVGVDPPPLLAEARIAAVMASGPDRPEPLSQFVPGDPAVGLVSGHRLPNTAGREGMIINLDVLERMRRGASPRAAVDAVLDANPQADAGLIAVDLQGNVYARNSWRVIQRPDLGWAGRERDHPKAAVAVLHNAIQPAHALAPLAVEVALAVMTPAFPIDCWIVVEAGTRVVLGARDAVMVDAELRATQVITTDATLLDGRRDGAAIYLGAVVRGADRILGITAREPYCVLENGIIRSLNGQPSLRVAVCGAVGLEPALR
ncbi:MAG: hypothetical protein U1F68_06125 [Gammaproteobacteria bacterium]